MPASTTISDVIERINGIMDQEAHVDIVLRSQRRGGEDFNFTFNWEPVLGGLNVSFVSALDFNFEGVNVLLLDNQGKMIDLEPFKKSKRRSEYWVIFPRVCQTDLKVRLSKALTES